MTTYKVPNNFEKSSYSAWNSLLYTIENSNEQEFTLLWQGSGGNLEKALQVFARLNKFKKHIIIKIIGNSISAHGLVYCYVKQKTIFKNGSITLHNVFDGRNNSGNKIFNDKYTQKVLNQCISEGLISAQEADKIIQNKLRLTIYPNKSRNFQHDWL